MSLRHTVRFLPYFLPAWIALAILLLTLAASGAAADDRLHEATVPVENRDRPAREEGFRRALGQVLVKLSGDRQVLQDSRIRDLQAQAGRYVQRFRYVEAGEGAVGLEVRFDGAALERLLAERGLPVWGSNRPGLMVWLAATHHGERVILGGDEGQELVEALQQVADGRGIRLVFPVMDLEDRSAVNFADLTGGFHEPVLRASERYSARYVLVAHVQPRAGGWSGRWRLFAQDFQETHQAEGDTVEGTLDAGLQGVVDILGRRLAIAGLLPTEDHVEVVVHGVDSLESYQRVREYLAGLSVVAEIRPHRLEPDRAVFLVQLRGSPRDLERGVRLGRVLEPSEIPADPFAEPGGMASVNLRLSR
jgi:uncharacterized protein